MRSCSDGDRSSSGWYKGAMMSSLVCGGWPSLGGWKKNRFLLAFLFYHIPGRSIDAEHLRHLPLMTAPGVNDTSPATCFFCTYMQWRVLYATIGKIASSIRHSHIISWNARLGRRTVRLRWTTSKCKWCMPVNHTTLLCVTRRHASWEIILQDTRTYVDRVCSREGCTG